MAANSFKYLWLSLIVLLLWVSPASGILPQLINALPLFCPFYFITGLSCPTCGLGRALLLIYDGQYAAAWSMQPLAYPFLVALALAPWWRTTVIAGIVRRRLLIVMTVSLVIFGLLRPSPPKQGQSLQLFSRLVPLGAESESHGHF